jgi:AcrR family transcriptional regulator
MLERKDGDRPRYSEGRDALLDAAVRVVSRYGLRGLTYRRVAEEARTTQGLVSYHFGSRAAFILEAAARANRRSLAGSFLERPPQDPSDFAQGLAAQAQRDADAHAFQFELALEARRRPDLARDVRGRYEEYFRATRLALERMGLDSDDMDVAARLLFAAVDGLVLQQLIFDAPHQTDDAMVLLRRLLSRLASPAEP